MWNVIFGGLAALGVAMIIDAEARRRMVPVRVPPPRPKPRVPLASYRRLQTEWSLGAWRN